MEMKVPLPSSDTSDRSSEWANQHFGSTSRRHNGLLLWWYQVAAPPEPETAASFEQRELVRRGRLASIILFLLSSGLLFFALPFSLFKANIFMLLGCLVLCVVVIIALLLNRHGKSNLTGLIIASGLNLGLFLVILAQGDLAASALPLFDLLVFSELFAASLLPVNWVFCSALINIIFIVCCLVYLPQNGDLATAMQTAKYVVILRPIALHIIVTTVLWLWVRSATLAIKRADRAEIIATLQRSIAEQEHVLAEEKRALEASIQAIMHTHILVANGHLEARVPLKDETVLWPIAVSLNNLLYRLQRLRQVESEYQQMLPRLQRANQVEYELHRTREEAALLLQALREAKEQQRSIRTVRGGTLLDPLIQELCGLYLSPYAPVQGETFLIEKNTKP